MKVNIDGHFGKTLRSKRKAVGMTQDELAKKTSLDRSYISMLERGIRKPSLEVTISIAATLNVEASEIVQEVVDKTVNAI